MFGRSRLARAGAGRIAGLRHEAVDHAVELHAVVEVALDQRLDLRDVLRRDVGPHLDDRAAINRVEIEQLVLGSSGGRRGESGGGGSASDETATVDTHIASLVSLFAAREGALERVGGLGRREGGNIAAKSGDLAHESSAYMAKPH